MINGQLIPKLEPADWLHLKDYGFAPGNYYSKCTECQIAYSGMDKRAWRCYECAKNLHKQHLNINLFEYASMAAHLCGNTKEDQRDILVSLMEEVGELSVEVKIDAGLKNQPHSADGVVGEAIDVIIVALDIIHSELGELNPETLNPIFKKKIDKWIRKYQNKTA